MEYMIKVFKILKSLVYPVTLLTLIAIYAIYVSIQALIISFTHDHTAAIYAAVVIPITLMILLLYVLDRILIKKIPYFKLLIGEFVIVAIIYALIVFKILV
jgi:hypothetical protein